MTSGDDVLLAIDFGFKRIGIASGNLLTRTATPLTTLRVGARLPWSELDALVAEWAPSRVIVGLGANDDTQAINERIREFVTALEARYGLPIETVDETLSTAAARAALREGRASGLHRRRIARERVDRHAACLIAEQWMGGIE